MKPEYLKGIVRQKSSFPNLEIIGLGIKDTWYAGSYQHVKAKRFIPAKQEIIQLVSKHFGRNTNVREWDWHHVVETQHVKLISEGNEGDEKFYFMPTILIHKPEHRFFSQNFNNNAFKELALISSNRNNSQSVKKQKIAIIHNLQMMYNNMYTGYPTLQKIADNVFSYHKQRYLL